MKIIVPLRPKNTDELILLVEKIDNRADIIEIWLDNFLDLEMLNLSKIKQNYPKINFLGVCKSVEEKGYFDGSETERVMILNKFLTCGGDFVDLDVTRNAPENIQKINSEKLILSFHDFESVPEDLEGVFKAMQAFAPAVYKFAITTNTTEQLNIFLAFVRQFPKDKSAIFTTMGDLGMKGREIIEEMGASWGAFYALDEKHKTAVGQKIL